MSSPPTRLSAQVVLAEAATMFRTRGYHKTRMQDIAGRFGVTHAALYYHFKSKQDILAQINLAAIRDLLEGARRVAEVEAPADERFIQVVRAHLVWVIENASLAASLLDFDDELPEDALAEIRACRREYTNIQRSIYAEGVAAGSLADIDPRLAINFVIGSANWVYHWYHGDQGDHVETADQIAQSGMRLLTNGFLADANPGQ